MNTLVGHIVEDPSIRRRKQWDLQKGLNDIPSDLDEYEDVYMWSYPKEKSSLTHSDGRIEFDKPIWHQVKSCAIVAWLELNCIGIRKLEPEETMESKSIWLYTISTGSTVPSGNLTDSQETERNLRRGKTI